jgi:hypothetical protein
MMKNDLRNASSSTTPKGIQSHSAEGGILNRTILPLLLLAAAVLAGCQTPSIRPLASDDKRITDAALVGRWQSEEGDTYTVQVEDDHYLVVIEDHDKQIDHKWNLEVQPIQLGKYRFADISVAKKERDTIDERWGPLFVPTHMFVRYTVDVGAGSLKLWTLKADWLSKQRVRPSYTSFDYVHIDPFDLRVMLTADTRDLQTFLESHADDPNAFQMEEFKRVKP